MNGTEPRGPRGHPRGARHAGPHPRAARGGPLTVPEIAEAIGARPTRSCSGSWACAATAGSEVKGSAEDGYFQYERSAEEAVIDRPPVDLGLLADIQRFGAADVRACFTCGTCTASCPLSHRRHVPAPDHPLRAAGHEGRAAVEQGAVDLLPVRRVRRDVPHPGRAERVHGGGPPLRDRQLRQDPIARTMYTRPVVGTLIAVCWRHSSPCSCTRPTGPRARVARHLRVHPGRADPQHRDRRDGRRLPRRPRRRRGMARAIGAARA